MFYSPDILSNRTTGLGTVWLVATLGSKSGLRRVQKKDILSVSIPRACDLIVHPPQPLALRLSSNLLYGVISVYNQQFNFLFSDVYQAYNRLKRDLYAATNDINIAPPNRRSEGLVLGEDPSFSIDFGLLPPLPVLIGPAVVSSDNGYSSNELNLSGFSSELSESDRSLLLDVVPDVSGSFSLGLDLNEDAGEVDFEFGERGDIVELPRNSSGLLLSNDGLGAEGTLGLSHDQARIYQALNPSDFEEQVGLEHQEGQRQFLPVGNPDDFFFNQDNDEFYLPNAVHGLNSSPPHKRPAQDDISDEHSPRKRAPRAAKVDPDTQLSIDAIKDDRDNYLDNMAAAVSARNARADLYVARTSAAERYVYLGELESDLRRTLMPVVLSLRESRLAGALASSPARPPNENLDLNDIETARTLAGELPTGDYSGEDLDEIELARRMSSDQELHTGHSSTLRPWSRSGDIVSSLAGSRVGSRAGSRAPSLGPPSSTGHPSYMDTPTHPTRRRIRMTVTPTGEKLVTFDEEDLDLDVSPPDLEAGFDLGDVSDSPFRTGTLGQETISARLREVGPDTFQFYNDLVQKSLSVGEPEQIRFDEVVPPSEHTRNTAAHDLFHTLVLATEGLITVQQPEAFASIDIHLN
ncbi:Rec8 like protein-domain-containing protein [Dipodascopsis tothii]|uniref:Rec8 like protein-domain-containing protein n=1 Tax=Dipodascopsis tothii TaxID=44089 RepID=UPI0034CEB1EB